MDVSNYQRVFYLVGIALNLAAMGYAVYTDAIIYAGTFALIIAYLTVRYRTVDRFSPGTDANE